MVAALRCFGGLLLATDRRIGLRLTPEALAHSSSARWANVLSPRSRLRGTDVPQANVTDTAGELLFVDVSCCDQRRAGFSHIPS